MDGMCCVGHCITADTGYWRAHCKTELIVTASFEFCKKVGGVLRFQLKHPFFSVTLAKSESILLKISHENHVCS